MKSLFLLFLTTFLVAADPIPEFSRQPYIQLATDDSIRVVWRTNKEMTPRVVFGSTVENLSSKVPAAQILTRTHPSLGGDNPIFKDAPVDTRQFEATITGPTR